MNNKLINYKLNYFNFCRLRRTHLNVIKKMKLVDLIWKSFSNYRGIENNRMHELNICLNFQEKSFSFRVLETIIQLTSHQPPRNSRRDY